MTRVILGGGGTNWRGIWSASTTYAIGDGVSGSDGHNYVSLVAANLNHNPVGDGHVHWSDLIPASVADKASGSVQSFAAEVGAPDFAPSGLSGASAAVRFVGGTATGAPAAGTFRTGDYVIAQDGTMWVCTAGGTPGTWQGGGSGVTSFKTRTGAVVPASGDYTAAQVTNAADKSTATKQAFTAEVGAPDFAPTGLSGATAAGRYVGSTASGAPATGTFAKGDWITDQNGARYTCTLAGSPGTWTQEPGIGVGAGSKRSVSATTDTLVLADAGEFVEYSNAGPVSVTIPKHSVVALPLNTVIAIAQFGSGQVTVAPVDGTVTLLAANGKATTQQYSIMFLWQRATDQWIAYGDTVAVPAAGGTPDWTGIFGVVGGSISTTLYPQQSFVTGHVTIVDDPKGSGADVASFAINGSDAPYSGAPPRGDIFSSFTFTPGMNKYFSIPLYTPPAGLPASILTGSGQWLLTSQLAIYGGNAQPQLTWSVTSDAMIGHAAPGGLHWSMFLRSPQNGQIWIGPTIDDNWHTLVCHVVCESTAGGTNGSVELWYDGVKQTLYDGSQTLSGIRILEQDNNLTTYKASLAMDSYRNIGLIAGTYTLYHGIPKIGPTYASVS